jgi:hypothetical protein
MIRLDLLVPHGGGDLNYNVVVEAGFGECAARLSVELYEGESDTPANFQGVELTADECRVLGAHLTAIAEARRGA